MSRAVRGTTWIAILGLAVSSPVAAQDAAGLEDGRWLPYVGCWVNAEGPVGPMTCVVPEGEGVALLTVEEAEVTDRRVIRADGAERPVEVAGCTGVETARFSSDGYRLYTRAEMTCGENVERETHGLIAMVSRDQWIEVRALGTGDDAVAWVRRYRPAPQTQIEAAGLADRVAVEGSARTLEMARAAASARITVEDITEAHARTSAAAVRTWIAEQGEPIRLNADRLVELADAGVSQEVIDVAVAVSFPERFTVDRDDPQRASDRLAYGRLGSWGTWSPYYYDPFYFRYNRYYGYGGYGYYGTGYYNYRPTVVVVRPNDPEPQGSGRVVKGRGYTRPGSGSSVGTATRRPSVSRPSSPSGSRVSGSGGFTRGSGSSSSGSKGTAKPRGGGG